MKATSAQINLVPAPLRVSLTARRPAAFQVPKAGRFLMLAMFTLAVGGILMLMALASGNDWNGFIAGAKTLSTARNQTVPSCVFQPPPAGIWTLNSY